MTGQKSTHLCDCHRMTVASSSNCTRSFSCSCTSTRGISCRIRVVVRASARVLVLWGKVRIVELWRVSAMCEWGSSRWIHTGPRLPLRALFAWTEASGTSGTQAVRKQVCCCCMRQRQRVVESRASTSAVPHRIATTTTNNINHTTRPHAQKEAEWLRPKNPAPAPTRLTSRLIWSACR